MFYFALLVSHCSVCSVNGVLHGRCARLSGRCLWARWQIVAGVRAHALVCLPEPILYTVWEECVVRTKRALIHVLVCVLRLSMCLDVGTCVLCTSRVHLSPPIAQLDLSTVCVCTLGTAGSSLHRVLIQFKIIDFMRSWDGLSETWTHRSSQ